LPRAELDRLRRDAELLAPSTRADLDAAAERLRDARCNVVVLGAFKRGKSALLNALLGRDVLPTGVVPLTSVATVIRHDDAEVLRVRFEDRVERHPLAALPRFATEPLNPGNRLGVRSVEVLLPDPLLATGLQLVDTPGIGSVHEHNTRAAQDVLGRVDAALCVTSADQPLAAEEAQLYRAAAERAGRMLYVLTKADRLHDGEVEQAAAFVRGALAGCGLDGDLLITSARDGRGLSGLRAELDAIADERGAIVARSVRRTIAAAAAELARNCELEVRALELPLAELDERAARLAARLDELQAAREDANDTFQRRAARMLDERVNRPLHDYARERRAAFDDALRAEADRLGAATPRELAAALDAWIDAVTRERFAALAAALSADVGDALAAIAAGHTRRIEQLLDDVRAALSDALGSVSLDVEMAAPAGFTFKLHDPEHALDIIVGGVRRSVPGALGRRLVLADARERQHALTDRHAGRLRAELVARANEAVAEHRRRLDTTVLDACAAIRDAVARARAARAQGAQRVEARLTELRAKAAAHSASSRARSNSLSGVWP